MASLYKRPGSPYWWIKYRDRFGNLCRESTQMRVANTLETRSARELEAIRTAEERRTASHRNERWSAWADEFVATRHPHGSYTWRVWGSRWKNLREFLRQHRIESPRQVQHRHALDYIRWRASAHSGVKAAGHNTALDDVRFLQLLLREAVNRGLISSNPLQRLGIRSHPRREKPEVTDADLEWVSQCIERDRANPHYLLLRRSFDIARWQGCRLAETWVNPLTDVEFVHDAGGNPVRASIRFKAKGNRIHVAPLHPQLWPLFLQLQAEGATETYPASRDKWGHPRSSLLWFQFGLRHRIKQRIPGFSFHCLRVTVATRLARANVSEAKAMRYVGHATTTVHRIYQRLRLEDLDEALTAISASAAGPKPSPNGSSIPGSPAGISGSPSQTRGAGKSQPRV